MFNSLTALQKTEIALDILSDKTWRRGKTNSFLDLEDDKVIINLKIKKVGSNKWNKPKWERAFQLFACYTIEPLEFTFYDKIENVEENKEIILPTEGKKVRVSDLQITYKNLKYAIPNFGEIFQEGAEIKLRLKNNPEIGKNFSDYRYWLLEDNSDKREDTFSLSIFSDYEIITPNGIIDFPGLTWWEKEDRELKAKWDKEEEKNNSNLEELEENNLPPSQEKQEILNNLFKHTLENSGNFSTHGNFLGKKAFKLSSLEEKEVREAIVGQVKQNPNQWRIEKINVSYQDGSYPYGAEMRKFFYDTFLIHQSAKIKLISKENRKREEEKMLSGVDFGKMHYKRGFADKEWTEIENTLSNYQTNIPLEEWLKPSNNHEQKPKNNWDFPSVAMFSIVGVIIILGVVWLVKKIFS